MLGVNSNQPVIELTIYITIKIIIFSKVVQCIQFSFGPCLLQYLEPCSENVIQYYVFSSDRPNSAPILVDSKDPIFPDWIHFNNKSTKLIVHGYGGNVDFHATKAVRSAYLLKPNTNVIIVDWGRLANLPCYPTAAFNTKQAGECIGAFLLKIKPMFGENDHFKQLHMIGFSLGAHVVSFASNLVHDMVEVMFDRITGLDPALPFFTTSDHKWKLDKTDAKFVDVVHTNAGIFGKIEQSGHVDFYLNGGQMQPHCKDERNKPLCSHMLAPVYFAESINNTGVGFWGVPCRSYLQYMLGLCLDQYTKTKRRSYRKRRILMGEYCLKKSKGMVFIETDSKSPYALG